MGDHFITNFKVRAAAVIQGKGAWIELILNYGTEFRIIHKIGDYWYQTKNSSSCERFMKRKLENIHKQKSSVQLERVTFFWPTLYHVQWRFLDKLTFSLDW